MATVSINKRKWDGRILKVWKTAKGLVVVEFLGEIQIVARSMKDARVHWRTYARIIRDGGRTTESYFKAHDAMREVRVDW